MAFKAADDNENLKKPEMHARIEKAMAEHLKITGSSACKRGKNNKICIKKIKRSNGPTQKSGGQVLPLPIKISYVYFTIICMRFQGRVKK